MFKIVSLVDNLRKLCNFFFFQVAFAMLICAASAGIIGHGVVAPLAVAHAPLASSYQNSNSISLHPTAVVASHAVAAPLAVAHAPVAAIGLGGIGLGGIGLGHGYLH